MVIDQSFPIPVGPQVVIVTPAMASHWLEHRNKGNRHLSPLVANRYAEAMRSGRWRLTHQGIAFDAEGYILDGQHRLQAVVIADIPVEFWVMPNCDRDTFTVLDVGRRRQAGHLIDHPHRVMIAAAARYVGAIDGTLIGAISSGVLAARVDNDQVIAVVDAWPELKDLSGIASSCYKAGRISGSPHLAMLAQAARTRHAHRITEWADGIINGVGLSGTDPRLHLRNRFMREQGARWSSSEAQRVLAYGLIVTAWNYWAVGRPMSVLKVKRTGEPVPPVIS